MNEQPHPTSDNVLTKLHNLLLYIIPQLATYPRDQKFVLADRIEVRLLEVQERCVRAYYSRERMEHLREANGTTTRTPCTGVAAGLLPRSMTSVFSDREMNRVRSNHARSCACREKSSLTDRVGSWVDWQEMV